MSIKIKLATFVKGDPQAPFAIVTTIDEGATLFPVLLHFTMLSVKQGGISTIF